MGDGEGTVAAITALLAARLGSPGAAAPSVSPAPTPRPRRTREASNEPADASLAGRLARNFVAYQARARGDVLRMEMFRQGLPRAVPLVQVPNLPSDIHDLAGLLLLHPYLFASRATA